MWKTISQQTLTWLQLSRVMKFLNWIRDPIGLSWEVCRLFVGRAETHNCSTSHYVKLFEMYPLLASPVGPV